MIEHLLLIEDSQPDAVVAQRMLQYSGLEVGQVTWAQTLTEGLAVLAAGGVDLILLDLHLSEGRGVDVVRPVHQAAPGVPILALTGMAGKGLDVATVALGVHDFLYKDRLDPEALAVSVRMVLARAAAARALRDATERERLLRQLIGTIASARHYDDVLDAAVDCIWQALPVDRVRVHWYQRGPRGPELVLAPGADEDASDVIDAGSLGFVTEVDQILGEDDPEGGWFQVEHRRAGQTYRVLPVGRVDGSHGVLALRPRSDVTWTPEQDRLLDALSQAITSAVGHTLEARALRRSLLAHSKMAAYLPQGIADRILAAPEAVHGMAGRRQDAVVLLVDVVGFTAWSESRDPRLVVEVLNGWFEVVDDILSRHGAILDKHMGDAVMAVFQVEPLARQPRRDMARRALAACAEVMRVFDPTREGADFEVHLAASLGQVLMGPVGSRHRTEYTVIGDTVNVASRLSTLPTHGGLMVNEALHDAVLPEELQRLGLSILNRSAHQLRGRQAHVQIYDLGLGVSLQARVLGI